MLAAGHDLLIIDDLSVGRASHVPAGAQFLAADLTMITPAELDEVIADFRPDGVVHLAAIHFIPYCMRNPERTQEVNVAVTLKLVEALARHPVEKFVFSSTMDVYPCEDIVLSEDMSPEPGNVYGLTKLMSEQIVAYGQRLGNFQQGTVLRFANVYGPDETNPHLIPDVLDRLANTDEPVLKFGYLGATRDFVYVADVVEAIAASLERDLPGFLRMNIGTGNPTAVRSVVEVIQHAVGDTREIQEDPIRFRAFDRKSLTPDIGRVKELLGWTPTWNLKDGIAATVAAYPGAVAAETKLDDGIRPGQHAA